MSGTSVRWNSRRLATANNLKRPWHRRPRSEESRPANDVALPADRWQHVRVISSIGPVANTDVEGGSYGWPREEDARPTYAARPDPPRAPRPQRREHRLRQGSAHRRGRLEGVLPARHARGVLGSRGAPLPDSDRGGKLRGWGLREDGAQQGAGAREPRARSRYPSAPGAARRDLRVLRLSDSGVGEGTPSTAASVLLFIGVHNETSSKFGGYPPGREKDHDRADHVNVGGKGLAQKTEANFLLHCPIVLVSGVGGYPHQRKGIGIRRGGRKHGRRQAPTEVGRLC